MSVSPLLYSLPFFAVGAFAAALLASYRAIAAGQRAAARKAAAERARLREASHSFEALADEERWVRDRELALANIYEITRMMSASMTFDDIFSVFSASLSGNLSFSTCDLLILKGDEEGSGAILERRYRVLKDASTRSVPERATDYRRLIEHIRRDPEGIWLSREEDAGRMEALGIRGEGVSTFSAIPLMGEKRLIGIIMFENLPRTDHEKAVLLAMQFALEMKKIILYMTVERLSVTDSLTGLYVRRYFFERLGEEVERSRSYGLNFAFLMIDIDDFKRCNDTFGHLVGDVVLKDVARIMKEHVREIDLVARYGGEEFAIVLPETSLDGARHAAERIRKTIADYIFRAYDEKLRITISAGVALYPRDGDTSNELVERADKALYRAKRSGKNLVCVFGK